MKKYILILTVALLGLISCGDDFLSSRPTDSLLDGQPAVESQIKSYLASAYQVLLFDSYADYNYNSLPLMSDLMSDDIFKGGGDAGDQHQLYLLSLYTCTPNEIPGGLWNIYFAGIARSNNALAACDNAVDVPEKNLAQYRAEAHFLRAYYTHLLWKFWGNIPYFTEPLPAPLYMAKQLKADEVYAEIMKDIDAANTDALPMNYTKSDKDVGRATKAAVMMLKARVVMYQKDASRYAEVTKEMADIINSGEFKLMDDFTAMWLNENEFCEESIFESNHLPQGRAWGAAWQGYGTNLPAFISPNGLNTGSNVGNFKGGWGFGPVRKTTWDIFENGDQRREGSINDWSGENYTARFQDTGYFLAKYAARVGYNPNGDTDLNYANNFRIFRYSEALLNYAELVAMHGQAVAGGLTAQNALDQVRKRAFGADNPIPANAANIKMERRREFIGEGMRYWDLVRWGDAQTVLTESLAESTRTWTPNKKYLPIPQLEIEKTAGTEFALEQNPY